MREQTASRVRRHRPSRAACLLAKVVAAGWFDVQRLATELVVSESMVGLYVSGAVDMPLERQLCLARFLIDNVPSLSRMGRNLLGQVQSAIAFAGSQTVLHQHLITDRRHL